MVYGSTWNRPQAERALLTKERYIIADLLLPDCA